MTRLPSGRAARQITIYSTLFSPAATHTQLPSFNFYRTKPSTSTHQTRSFSDTKSPSLFAASCQTQSQSLLCSQVINLEQPSSWRSISSLAMALTLCVTSSLETLKTLSSTGGRA